MNLTFQAQCYLAAWEANEPISGGLAHGELLRKCNLDYSWASLARIDGFLDRVRERARPVYGQFIEQQANTNLLYLLAFYVGEVRARVAGVPSRWMSWEELLAADPTNAAFGQGFHSSAVQCQPGCFLPLVAIVIRLFEGPEEKSVSFSSQFGLENIAEVLAGSVEQPLAPVPAASLVADVGAAFKGMRARRRAEYLAPDWPAWFASDPLGNWSHDVPRLLGQGRMVWAAVVQANGGLFDGSVGAAPLELLYDPRGMVDPDILQGMAERLFQLKGQKNPEAGLKRYADHLANEYTRLFNWTPPGSWLPYRLTATTSFLELEWLPTGQLLSAVFPVLVCDACPGSVIVAPWEMWPAELHAQWVQASGAEHHRVQPGAAVRLPALSAHDKEEGERLYREGLALWHAEQRDDAGAIAKWRQAGRLHHYLALCALSAALVGKTLRTAGSARAESALIEESAEADMRAFDIAELRLGLVEAAKLHLRPDRPDPRRGDEQAKGLLQLGAVLGDNHAGQMLKVLERIAIA